MQDEQQLFEPISFNLKAGESLSITGANGSGKTTLLRTFIGVHSQYSGQFKLSRSPFYIGHKSALHPDLSVRQNLQFWQANDVDFNFFKIKKYIDFKCRELSAGQLQRVSLSRLLASKQKLWLIDEPCANLDIEARQQIEKLFARHLDEGGVLLLATHDSLINTDNTICLS